MRAGHPFRLNRNKYRKKTHTVKHPSAQTLFLSCAFSLCYSFALFCLFCFIIHWVLIKCTVFFVVTCCNPLSVSNVRSIKLQLWALNPVHHLPETGLGTLSIDLLLTSLKIIKDLVGLARFPKLNTDYAEVSSPCLWHRFFRTSSKARIA
jgi:hypothetical protein